MPARDDLGEVRERRRTANPLDDIESRESPPLPEPTPVSVRPGEEDVLTLLQSGLGQPIPLVYGPHLVAGNVIFQHEDGANTILFVALGEGEWNALKILFVNGKVIDHTDGTKVHFHPGIDGETGVETTANNGNQKTCSFWPATYTDNFTFSGTAYIAIKLSEDPESPGPGFSVVGIYETRKVRIFDSAGAITSFVYSTNPAWILLDILLETEIRTRTLVNSALSTAQKARVDFQSFIDVAADCDVDIGGGKKRFEANIAFVRQTNLQKAVELLLIIGRSFMQVVDGKFTLTFDESRAAVATVTEDEILEGAIGFGRKSVRSLANRVVVDYRNANSGDGVGTFSSTGTAVTGVSTKFTQLYKDGEPMEIRSGTEEGEHKIVDSVASDTALTLKTGFSVNQTAESHGNPALDFQLSVRESADETAISETAKDIKVNLDLGVMDAGQADRTAVYVRLRTLLQRQAGFVVPPGLADSKDWLPGDVLTGPKDVEAEPGTTESWEVLEAEDLPDGSRRVACQIFDSTIFSDTERDEQPQIPQVEGEAMVAVTGNEKLGAADGFTVFQTGDSTPLDVQGSMPPQVVTDAPLDYDSESSGGNSWLRWTWSAFTLWKTNGSTIAIGANTAVIVFPAKPSGLGEIAGSATAAQTLYVRQAYVLDGLIVGMSESSDLFNRSVNSRLTIPALAAPTPNVYDGWVPLIGLGDTSQRLQSDALPASPIAFGVGYTEIDGGLDTSGTTPLIVDGTATATTTFPSIMLWNQAIDITRYFFPRWDIVNSYLSMVDGAQTVALVEATSIKQAFDGFRPLSTASMAAVIPAAGGGSGSGGGGGGGGGCFMAGTMVVTEGGSVPIQAIRPGAMVMDSVGKFNRVIRLVRHSYSGEVFDVGGGAYVTPEHHFKRDEGLWFPASQLFDVAGGYSGAVYNLEVAGRHEYVIEGNERREVAHNAFK